MKELGVGNKATLNLTCVEYGNWFTDPDDGWFSRESTGWPERISYRDGDPYEGRPYSSAADCMDYWREVDVEKDLELRSHMILTALMEVFYDDPNVRETKPGTDY